MKVPFGLLCSSCLILIGSEALASEDRKGVAFFETRIRPVLIQHCYECHAPGADEIGGKLFLDSREGIRKGGESGPALVEGDAEASLLAQSLTWKHGDLQMPPEEPLPETVVSDFVRWIEMGAPDPRSGEAREVAGKTYAEDSLWSFAPVTDPAIPDTKRKDWARDPIDQFVLARLEDLEMEPVSDAPPAMLLRRLSYDLIGLPPDREEVLAFTAEFEREGQEAVSRWVDRLLESAQFGERWGRYWLDVARYAESNGNDGLSRNPTFPHAWRYRDYVIDAFQRDLPYDQFLKEQIAGDLLPADNEEERDRLLVATGFLALGAKPAKAMNNNFDMDVVADQIDVIGSGIMGLSVACARCHDHKFDPIPTRDYYALAGFFTSTETMWGLAGNEKLTAPPTDLHVLKTAPKVLPPEGWKETVLVLESNTGKPKAIPKPKWAPGTPLAMGVRDAKEPADAKINLKGDAKKLGESVPRGFLTACAPSAEEAKVAIDSTTSGRLQLAEWLASEDHPQTARVMVNRIWQHLFGRGIVSSPDDFGVYGARPSHPQLLDHLATRFVEAEWSVKEMIRAIVLSRTYQLSSEADPADGEADPDNQWLARHSRRRLDAEALRDSVLQVSGQLDLTPAAGSLIRHRDILVNLAGDDLQEPSRHRSVYLCYLRNAPPPELAAFDLPDFTSVTGKRDASTVPGQALFLYNSPFILAQAEHFAVAALAAEESTEGRVRWSFHRALNRDPNPEEAYRARELVEQTLAETDSEKMAWMCLCQGLLASNEFRYVD